MVTPRFPLVSRLLVAAEAALAAEDSALALAFAKCPDGKAGRENAPGLTYWVYETTLAYVLFKAWLPLARVDWEPRYSSDARGSSRLLDLRVWDPSTRRPRRSIAFELKWWNAHSAGLEADAVKLRDATAEYRYILAFWWNRPDAWTADRRHTDELAKRIGNLVHISQFPTRGPQKDAARYFALAAFEVAD